MINKNPLDELPFKVVDYTHMVAYDLINGKKWQISRPKANIKA